MIQLTFYVAIATILLVAAVVLLLFLLKIQRWYETELNLRKIAFGDFFNTKPKTDKLKKWLKSRLLVLDIYNLNPGSVKKYELTNQLDLFLKDICSFKTLDCGASVFALLTFDCDEEIVIQQLLKFTRENQSIYIGLSPCINEDKIRLALDSSDEPDKVNLYFSGYSSNAIKALEIGVFNKKQISRYETGDDKNAGKFSEAFEAKLYSCFDSYNIEKAAEIIKASYENAGNYSQCMYISNHLLHILHTALAKKNITVEEVYGDNVNLYRWSASTTKKNAEIQHIINWYTQAINYIKENIDKLSRIEYKIEKYIEENYDKDISITTMAEEFKVSSQYFSRYFKTLTGNNFLDTLNKYRIKKALELIDLENLSMTEIAKMTGFNSYKSFARNFKKYTGEIPSKYTKNN